MTGVETVLEDVEGFLSGRTDSEFIVSLKPFNTLTGFERVSVRVSSKSVVGKEVSAGFDYGIGHDVYGDLVDRVGQGFQGCTVLYREEPGSFSPEVYSVDESGNVYRGG